MYIYSHSSSHHPRIVPGRSDLRRVRPVRVRRDHHPVARLQRCVQRDEPAELAGSGAQLCRNVVRDHQLCRHDQRVHFADAGGALYRRAEHHGRVAVRVRNRCRGLHHPGRGLCAFRFRRGATVERAPAPEAAGCGEDEKEGGSRQR